MNDHTQSVLSLLSEHGPRLHAMMFRITLRDDATEDLMQDLFIRLSRSKALERASNPAGYASRAAIRLAFDWRRAQRRRRDTQAISEDYVANGEWQHERLEQREALKDLLDKMGKLSTTSRDIVVMRYLEEKSYEEIANLIGKTSHQVRALCYKAIVRLRQWQSCCEAVDIRSSGVGKS